jgi:hypothetical protein
MDRTWDIVPNSLVFRLLLSASPLAIKSSGCDILKPMLEFKVRDCHQSGSFLTSPDIGILVIQIRNGEPP